MPVAVVTDLKHTPTEASVGAVGGLAPGSGGGRMVGSEAQPDRVGFPWCSKLLVSAVAVYVYF